MKRWLLVAALLAMVLVTSGCLPDANVAAGTGNDLPGFWTGLWHGAIMLISFVISLFKDNVGIYEVNNSGGWYDFGFMLGALMFLGGGGRGSKQKKR